MENTGNTSENESTPTSVSQTVGIRYLTDSQIEQLIDCSRGNRHGARDAAMVMVCYRHAFRVSELVALRWDQVNLDEGTIQVVRVKGSNSGVQPLAGVELRALRALKREAKGQFVFASERGAPFTVDGFAKLVARAGRKAGLGHVHPHMLRHSTGYALVNRGVDTRTIQDYLGHKNIQNTVRYTSLNSARFRGLLD